MSQVSTKKKPSGSAFISSLDPKLKERILEMEIDRELLNKFDEQEKMVDVATLSDLRDLSCKTETEVYNTLNRMFKNNQ